jgi:hypothetical protein
MTSSQECRGYALECVQLARKSEDESERAACFEMARAWLRAASVIDDTLPRYGGSLARLCTNGTRVSDTDLGRGAVRRPRPSTRVPGGIFAANKRRRV